MNELKYDAEFRSVLADYKPSLAALDILKQTRLVLLAGPTSSGRNTIIGELVKTGKYYHPVPDTTRNIRIKDGKPIEKNGREYWFRTEEEMLDGLNRGQYIEAAIIHNQQVSGRNVNELAKANEIHKIAVEDIEPVGVQTMHRLKPDVIIMFILPPSFEIWMQRLRGRGGLPDDEVKRRLISAHEELTAALTYDYYIFVINEKIDKAINEIQATVESGQIDPEKQELGRTLAEELKQATEKHLQFGVS